MPLMLRKIEKINEINNLLTRESREQDPTLKNLLSEEIDKKMGVCEEYSGMVACLIRSSRDH